MGNLLAQLNQKTTILGIVSLGCFSVAGVSMFKIRGINGKINWIQETKEYTPQECKEELENRQNNKLMLLQQQQKQMNESKYNNINYNKDEYNQLTDKELISKRMLIKGTVKCDQPLQSRIQPELNDFIYRNNFCIIKYSNEDLKKIFQVGRVARQAPKSFSSFYVPEFHLIDPINQESKLEVWVHLEPKICSSSFNHYSERYTDRQLNLFEKFRSKVSSFMNVMGILLSKDKHYTISKGIEIGFNEYELGIRTGGALTIIGDIVYNLDTKELKMINPLTIIGNKLKYIERLKVKRKDKYFNFYIFTVIGGIALYFLIKELRRVIRGGRMLVNQRQDSLKDIKQALVKAVNDMKCDKCSNNNKSIIYKPCGHLIYCKDCHIKEGYNICPLCNLPISDAVEIYLS